jgi:hypothetical protein
VTLFYATLSGYLSERVILTELATDADKGTVVDLSWLMSALEHARAQGQTKTVGYLEAIAVDVVFEMEASARRRRDT